MSWLSLGFSFYAYQDLFNLFNLDAEPWREVGVGLVIM